MTSAPRAAVLRRRGHSLLERRVPAAIEPGLPDDGGYATAGFHFLLALIRSRAGASSDLSA